MGTEYYHTLIEKGGKVIGYGNVITADDWQIMGNENNRAICPPEEKWIGYKTTPFPHPTFVRIPPNVEIQWLHSNPLQCRVRLTQ